MPPRIEPDPRVQLPPPPPAAPPRRGPPATGPARGAALDPAVGILATRLPVVRGVNVGTTVPEAPAQLLDQLNLQRGREFVAELGRVGRLATAAAPAAGAATPFTNGVLVPLGGEAPTTPAAPPPARAARLADLAGDLIQAAARDRFAAQAAAAQPAPAPTAEPAPPLPIRGREPRILIDQRV